MSIFQQEIVKHATKQEYMPHTQGEKKQSKETIREEIQVNTLNQLL